MKKLNLVFALFGFLAISFFSSCDTEDPSDVSPLLSLTVAGLNNGEILEGTTFSVTVEADENPSTKKKVKTLLITSNQGVDTTININAASYTEIFDFDAPAAGVTEVYTFRIEDNDQESTTESLSVTGTSGVVSTPFGTEVQGAFFHVWGSLEGSYDLIGDSTVAMSGPEGTKDMKNNDLAGNNFTGSFTTGTGNQTLFVRDNSYDYDNGSVEDAIAAFNAGNSTTTVLNPVTGTILIAKLRGGSDYAVIKVVSMDPSNNECSCGNLGKLTFDYKKSN